MPNQSPKTWLLKFAMKNWNTSNLRAYRPILVNVVLYHLRGCGIPYDTTTPSFITNSRDPIIGLSNEVSFVSESCVVPEQQPKMFCKKLPVRYNLTTSVRDQMQLIFSCQKKPMTYRVVNIFPMIVVFRRRVALATTLRLQRQYILS